MRVSDDDMVSLDDMTVTKLVTISEDIPTIIVESSVSVMRLPVVANTTAVVMEELILSAWVEDIMAELTAKSLGGATYEIALGKGVPAVI